MQNDKVPFLFYSALKFYSQICMLLPRLINLTQGHFSLQCSPPSHKIQYGHSAWPWLWVPRSLLCCQSPREARCWTFSRSKYHRERGQWREHLRNRESTYAVQPQHAQSINHLCAVMWKLNQHDRSNCARLLIWSRLDDAVTRQKRRRAAGVYRTLIG